MIVKITSNARTLARRIVLSTPTSRPPIGALVIHSGLPAIFMGELFDGCLRLLVIRTTYGTDSRSFASEFGGSKFQREARSDVGFHFAPDGNLEILSETSSLQSLLVATVRSGQTEIGYLHDIVTQAMKEKGDPSTFLAGLLFAANEGQTKAKTPIGDGWRCVDDESAIGDFMLYAAAITNAEVALTVARAVELPVPLRLSCLRSVDDSALLAELVDAFLALPYAYERREIMKDCGVPLVMRLLGLGETALASRVARYSSD